MKIRHRWGGSNMCTHNQYFEQKIFKLSFFFLIELLIFTTVKISVYCIGNITKTCPCNIEIFWALEIENFQLKNFDIFLIFAQNIVCGCMLDPSSRGGSNEYPQSMFWSKNKKIGIPLHTPVLLYKNGFKGGIYYTEMFLWCMSKFSCYRIDKLDYQLRSLQAQHQVAETENLKRSNLLEQTTMALSLLENENTKLQRVCRIKIPCRENNRFYAQLFWFVYIEVWDISVNNFSVMLGLSKCFLGFN